MDGKPGEKIYISNGFVCLSTAYLLHVALPQHWPEPVPSDHSVNSVTSRSLTEFRISQSCTLCSNCALRGKCYCSCRSQWTGTQVVCIFWNDDQSSIAKFCNSSRSSLRHRNSEKGPRGFMMSPSAPPRYTFALPLTVTESG